MYITRPATSYPFVFIAEARSACIEPRMLLCSLAARLSMRISGSARITGSRGSGSAAAQWCFRPRPRAMTTHASAGVPHIPSGMEHCHQRLSVAPMMDWTDVHYRQLARLISRRTWLWTEMVVDKTILHAPQLGRFLWFPPEQHPIVLQLGGSDPETLAAAAVKAAPYGYDEINLNCGCPSDRVAGAGCFGAALMTTPQLVADCMAAMRSALDAAGYGALPLSVKCRLGVDDHDSYAQLQEFVRTVSERGGVRHFVVHARKCLLRGLSPAQNRSVPPLRHAWVWGLKRDFPHLHFSLNGGVLNGFDAAGALSLDAHGLGAGAISGVMIGRAAYHDPWGVLGDADVALFGDASNPGGSRREVLERYCDYCDGMLGRWGIKPNGHREPNARVLIKPALNLFFGERGSKRWKAAMDGVLKAAPRDATVRQLLDATLHLLPPEVLSGPPPPAGLVAAAAAAGGGNARVAVTMMLTGGGGGGGAAGNGAAEAAGAASNGAAEGEDSGSDTEAAAAAAPRQLPAPPPYALDAPLPAPSDRAAGEDELRRRQMQAARAAARAAEKDARRAASARGGGAAAEGGGGAAAAGEEQQQAVAA
ncbi:MAG: dihydrouridine synthase-domain-containing protein [Monoraphidium minutum]|nr:MAG: dihydrouridine synthase-domain-containing protein [Monoraphidium minutum]